MIKWSSKSFGSRFQHYFFYVLIQCRLVPIARFFLAFITLYYALTPKYAQRSAHYLKRRFPHANSFEKWLHTYKIYANFANLLLDRVIFANKNTLAIKSHENNSQKVLLEALKEEEGCLILSGHLGAWQLGLFEFENVKRPINLVQLIQSGDNDKHYFQHSSYTNENSIKFISPADSFKASLEISSALNKNEIVCMMGDRVLHENEKYILMPFLGGKIPLPLAPFSICSITQKAMIVTFSVHEKNCIRGVWAEKISIPYGIHKKPELLKPYLARYIEALEFMVENYPHQFFNFYNLWEEDENDN